MAKISFTKLGITKNANVITIYHNEQPIEIKEYLPVEEKLNLVSDIINNSVDTNNFYNPARVHIYKIIGIIQAYTNINFTDKQKEDIYKLFDLLVGSGLAKKIILAIPDEEMNFIQEATEETIKSIYNYKNSALGIMETISQDYSNLNLDATEIQQKLADPTNMEFLKTVLTKMG